MISKTLLLLRHAKSSWDNPELDDHDRPLNKRGRKAAKRMGQLLRDQGFPIDLVLCSTSARTTETARLVFAEFESSPEIVFREDLYHAAPDAIASILQQATPNLSCMMVIGHNPGLEEYLSLLTGEAIRFPTASMAQLELTIDDLHHGGDSAKGRLIQIWRPREIVD